MARRKNCINDKKKRFGQKSVRNDHSKTIKSYSHKSSRTKVCNLKYTDSGNKNLLVQKLKIATNNEDVKLNEKKNLMNVLFSAFKNNNQIKSIKRKQLICVADSNLKIISKTEEEIKSLLGNSSQILYKNNINYTIAKNFEKNENNDTIFNLFGGTGKIKPADDICNSEDPFAVHLNNSLPESLYMDILARKSINEKYLLQWPILGNVIVEIPGANSKSMDLFDIQHKVPHIINKIDWNQLYIKFEIQKNLSYANNENIRHSVNANQGDLTLFQKELFSIINNYQDFLYCERTLTNENEIIFVYCLHLINHLLKSKSKILHHNENLSKISNASISELPDVYRDQGLVRPKILIIVPFRHSCLKIINMLTAILFSNDESGSVINKQRFLDEYGKKTINMPRANPKPEEYETLFSGNTDDTFKIGISITKKTLKLYSEFYSSDIIIASALGLRMLVGAVGEEERDYDFLASIEILLIDQTEIIFMQNWDHLIHVLNHLHLQPKKSHNTDFSRVRNWSVNGWSKYYRQTLIFSKLHLPEIHSLFNKKCVNYVGKIKVVNSKASGSINHISVQIPNVFYKFTANNHTQAIKTRFEFLTSKILPQYWNSITNNTLIYIPSYFDYVKLRNYFKKEGISFVQICEYTKDAKVARARDMFFHGDVQFLLYSERFHFFRRIRIKGIKHIIFFGLPSFSHFYSELCNFMRELDQNVHLGTYSNMTITTLYCKYDAMYLTAILGTDLAEKMITSEKFVHTILTDN